MSPCYMIVHHWALRSKSLLVPVPALFPPRHFQVSPLNGSASSVYRAAPNVSCSPYIPTSLAHWMDCSQNASDTGALPVDVECFSLCCFTNPLLLFLKFHVCPVNQSHSFFVILTALKLPHPVSQAFILGPHYRSSIADPMTLLLLEPDRHPLPLCCIFASVTKLKSFNSSFSVDAHTPQRKKKG